MKTATEDTEIGIVKSVTENETVVTLQPTEACEDCGARLFCRPGKNGAHEMRVVNAVGAVPGQVVELAETGNLLLILSLLQYGLPLVGLLSGIFLVYGTAPVTVAVRIELIMAVAGLAGLLLGGVIANISIRRLSMSIGYVYRIAAIRPLPPPSQ